MRFQITAALALCAALSPVAAFAADETELTICSGKPVLYELEGNPSTGYVWALDEETSRNLELVSVNPEGYADTDDEDMPGAPAMVVFELIGLKAGTATLEFRFERPWEDGEPARTHTLELEVCGPAADG